MRPLGLAGVDFFGQVNEGPEIFFGNDFPDFKAHASVLSSSNFSSFSPFPGKNANGIFRAGRRAGRGGKNVQIPKEKPVETRGKILT
jgi:hypothetical protein